MIWIVNSFKQFLDSKFKLKDLGTLKYFLGLEVARTTKGISLCKRKYTLDLLAEQVCWLVDCFTNALGQRQFFYLLSKMNLMKIYSSS